MNLFAIWSLYFSLEPLEKCMTFKDIFPGLSRFRNFEEKIQDFPRGVGTLYVCTGQYSVAARN